MRDRLVERDGTANPQLAERHELSNQILLIDDDLRETALALGGIEHFLADALALLESEEVSARKLATLATDGDILDRLDTLSETLQSLRRSLAAVAVAMK
ncbi:MAG TPA: hypothetical protein VFF06_24610 [Polyangia bacterium]|nr:hypothetical protein [Polyangia bacterium]